MVHENHACAVQHERLGLLGLTIALRQRDGPISPYHQVSMLAPVKLAGALTFAPTEHYSFNYPFVLPSALEALPR